MTPKNPKNSLKSPNPQNVLKTSKIPLKYTKNILLVKKKTLKTSLKLKKSPKNTLNSPKKALK